MARPGFSSAALLLGAGLVCGGQGVRATEATPLPPVAGELTGGVTAWPGAPALQWRCRFLPATGPGSLALVLEGTGAGTSLEIAVTLHPSGELVWQVRRAEIDLAVWQPALAARWPMLSAYTYSGRLLLGGQGTLKDGVVGGTASLELQEGRVENTAQKLVVEGITLSFQVDDLAARKSARAQRLAWSGGKSGAIPLGQGALTFSLAKEAVHVDGVEWAVLGGMLNVGSFDLDFARPEFDVAAQVSQLDVTLLLPLLPPVLAEAQGRLDGRLVLHYGSRGLAIGAGQLSLRSGTQAKLRLLPSPGILSGSLPKKVNDLYPGLVRIEMGETFLQADQMDVQFLPENDAAGRSATIRIAGGPSDRALKAPLILDLNIVGPLEPLVNLGVKLGGM